MDAILVIVAGTVQKYRNSAHANPSSLTAGWASRSYMLVRMSLKCSDHRNQEPFGVGETKLLSVTSTSVIEAKSVKFYLLRSRSL